MAKRTLVTIELAVMDDNDDPVYDEGGQIFETKKAWLHHWGSDIAYIKDENGKIIFANQITVAIVEDFDDGSIYKVDPGNIKVVGFETYDFKK